MSQAQSSAPPLIAPATGLRLDAVVYVGLAVAGALLWWLGHNHVARLPVWAPWEFSWVEFLSLWVSAWWYIRGLTGTPRNERPWWPRQLTFFVGVMAIYAVLETRFEYLAEHQFFFNRIQHVVMHHVGPLLLALAWPGATLLRGMPGWIGRLVLHRVPVRIVHVLQQPVLAAALFSGTFFFWLIPAVHFRAMIDLRLFALMNWTMVIEGILFWCLVLDPRPSPPARTSFGARAALAMVVMFPQIIGGAMIAFDPRDLYSFYDLCGRIYPELGAHYDQTVGGLIIWIPPSMMSVIALLLVLNTLRLCEKRKLNDEIDDSDETRPVLDSRGWTGG